MSFDMSDRQELEKVHQQIQLTRQLPEEETHFLPPRMENGTLKSAVRVSQGEVVEAEATTDETVVVEPDPCCEEGKEEQDHAKVEDIVVGSEGEKSLVDEGVIASVSGGVSDIAQGGSDDIGEVEMSVKDIVAHEMSEKLAEANQNVLLPEYWRTR